MAQAQYGTLITNIGLAKIANAQVTQSKVGLENIALGDGNGAHYVPTQNQTALVNEVWRGPVADVSIDPKNNNRITVKAVIPVTVGGFTIREIGVFDNEGFLIAVGQYPEKYKPQLIEGVAEETIIHFVIETNNANVVKLNIDPTVIIASQEYVDKKFNYLDSRIGDTSKLETDYKKDTVGAVNEIQHELNDIVENLGFHEHISAVLERGTNEINTPVKTLCSVTGLEGRTIINHVPLFDSGAWSLHGNATVTAPNVLTLNVTGPAQDSYVTINVKENTQYTIYGECNPSLAFTVWTGDGKTALKGSNTPTTYTFTVPPGHTSIKIYLGPSGVSNGVYTFKNIALYEGTAALPFVANMQGITNPTIENIRNNMIPAFHYGGAFNVPGWLYVATIDPVNVTATFTSDYYAHVLVPVVPGTKYTFACTRNAQVKITSNNGSFLETEQIATLFEESAVQNGNMNATFTVPTGVYFVRISFINPTGGSVSYPRMVKGATPAAYKPQIREALTVKTTLHTGESLKVDAVGQLVKTKKYETVELDGSDELSYSLYHAQTVPNGKLINIKGVAKFFRDRENLWVVKYNGTLLNIGKHTEIVDAVGSWIEQDNLYVSIANTDSGWGPNYNPTPAEIVAYFMGYMRTQKSPTSNTVPGYAAIGTPVTTTTANVTNTNTIPVANGSIFKIGDLLHVDKFNVVVTAINGNTLTVNVTVNALAGDYVYNTTNRYFTETLPTKTSLREDWRPYKLVYSLPSTLSEVVSTVGSLTLDEGENMLVVSEGRIVQEVTTPYYDSPTGITYINALNTQLAYRSWLNYDTLNLVGVYVNGKLDPSWQFGLAVANGNSYVYAYKTNPVDPAAVYTVDYIPMALYKVSAPTNAVTVEYADKLGGVIQSLVTTAAKLGAQAANMQNSPSFRFGYDEGGLYIVGKGDI